MLSCKHMTIRTQFHKENGSVFMHYSLNQALAKDTKCSKSINAVNNGFLCCFY